MAAMLSSNSDFLCSRYSYAVGEKPAAFPAALVAAARKNLKIAVGLFIDQHG